MIHPFLAGAQELEHGLPTPADNFLRRHRQSFTLPRIGGHAGGGLVIKKHVGELVVVQDAGNNAANTSNRSSVITL